MKKGSRGVIARVKIGSNVVSLDLARERRLKRDYPLRRDALAMQPHGDMRLPDALVGQLGKALSNDHLPSGLGDRFSNDVYAHMSADINTASVIRVNTRSDIRSGQTADMARSGNISDFWRRFLQARTAYRADLPVRQEDVAREWSVRQSAVTKWKTGKSKPDPDLVRQMVMKYDVCFEWLDLGRGPMRAPKAMDPIVAQVIEAMEALSPDAKVEVLKAAITQQALQLPALAEKVKQAQQSAEKLARPKPARAS